MDTKKVTFSSMCIVINIVLGMVISMINIPLLFLDTVGTVLGAVVLYLFWVLLLVDVQT